MNTYADKTSEQKSGPIAIGSVTNVGSQKKSGGKPDFQVVNNRPEAIAQRKMQTLANNSPQMKIQPAYNNLPVRLNIQSSDLETPKEDRVAQLATADISYKIDNGGIQNERGDAVGLGGVGGESHSEQGIWGRVENTITTALGQGSTVSVTFTVDTTICNLCSPWFEGTVWQAMNDANNEGTFHLYVEVGGSRVEVNGDQTIWPNEIADAPTWDRLSDFDKMDRFLTDNRDEDGDLRGQALSAHVSGLHADLLEAMAIGGLVGDDVEGCLETAKDNAVRMQVLQYDYDSEAAMREELDDIELFTIMSSGGIGSIPKFNYDQGRASGQQNWKIALAEKFQGWLEDWIDSNLEDHKIQAENAHVSER